MIFPRLLSELIIPFPSQTILRAAFMESPLRIWRSRLAIPLFRAFSGRCHRMILPSGLGKSFRLLHLGGSFTRLGLPLRIFFQSRVSCALREFLGLRPPQLSPIFRLSRSVVDINLRTVDLILLNAERVLSVSSFSFMLPTAPSI